MQTIPKTSQVRFWHCYLIQVYNEIPKYWNVAKGGSDRNYFLKKAMYIILDSLTQIATLPNHVCHGHTYTRAAHRYFQILILLHP